MSVKGSHQELLKLYADDKKIQEAKEVVESWGLTEGSDAYEDAVATVTEFLISISVIADRDCIAHYQTLFEIKEETDSSLEDIQEFLRWVNNNRERDVDRLIKLTHIQSEDIRDELHTDLDRTVEDIEEFIDDVYNE